MAVQGLLLLMPLLLLAPSPRQLQVLAAPSSSVPSTNPSSDPIDDLIPIHEDEESSLISDSFLGDDPTSKHVNKRSAPPSSPNTWMPLSARKNPWDQKIGSLSDEDLLHLIRVVSQRYNGDSNEEGEGGSQEDSIVAGEKRALAFLAKNNDLPKSVMRKKIPSGENAVGPSVETSLEKDKEEVKPDEHEEEKVVTSPPPSPSPTEGPKEDKRGISSIVRNKSYNMVGGKRSLSTLVKNRDLPTMGSGGGPGDSDDPLSEKNNDLPFQMKNIASLSSFNGRPSLRSDSELTGADSDVQFEADKRHIGSLVSSGNYPFGNRYSKRYFASLLKSSRPFMHPRSGTYDQKRFYASLLKDGNPERQKKYFASLLKSNTSPFTSYSVSDLGLNKRYIDPDYEDLVDTEQEIEKKHIGSLFRDNNDDKRFYASLLDDQEAEKRHIGSLRGKKSYDDALEVGDEEALEAQDVEKKHIGSLRAGKRYYASLLDNKSAEKKHIGSLRGSGSRYFSSMQNVEKKHIGSLRAFGKRHYSSLLDDSQELQKKHISSLLSGKRDEKRYFGSSLDEEDSDDDQDSTDASFVSGDKRHFSSLLDNKVDDKRFYGSILDDHSPDKKHYSSLLRSNNDDKRHFSSLLDDNSVEKKHIGSLFRDNDKRYYASLLDDHDVDKKHIGSLFRDNDKRYYASLLDDQDIEKKHISSLLRGRSEDKRYYASLLDDHDVDKKHISSLLRGRSDGKRYYASLLDDHDVDKKHIGSLFRDNGDKRFYGSLLDDHDMDKKHIGSLFRDNDKRYYASLLDDHDMDKKHISSLLRDDKRFYGSLLDDRDKKHISSLFRDSEDKRFYGSLLDDHEAEKKHYSSLLRSNGNSKRFFPSLTDSDPLPEDETQTTEVHEEDQSQGNDDASHQRTKRYIGALAKNNNLPFVSTSRHYRRDVDAYRSPTPYSFYLEGLIQDALRKEILKRRLLEASEEALEEQKRNIQALARIGTGYKSYPGKRDFDEEDDYDVRNDDFDDEDADDYPINNEDKRSIATLAKNNLLPPYHKRFLGSLARQGWFPRQFRGFHVDDSPSKRRLGGILPFTYSPY